MSLVDYASSSDDEISEAEEERGEPPQPQLQPQPQPQPLKEEHPPPLNNQRRGLLVNQEPDSSAPRVEKLPDASLLLNSPTVSVMAGNDHASRVAAAMAESASRKRDSNGLASSFSRTKVPRGSLLHTRSVPDTVGGVLLPPQLRGRSNVVTEDISKLFVRKHAESQPGASQT